jgi:hypothetical protein
MRANAKKGAARKCVFMVITCVRTSGNALVRLKLSHLGQTRPRQTVPVTQPLPWKEQGACLLLRAVGNPKTQPFREAWTWCAVPDVPKTASLHVRLSEHYLSQWPSRFSTRPWKLTALATLPSRLRRAAPAMDQLLNSGDCLGEHAVAIGARVAVDSGAHVDDLRAGRVELEIASFYDFRFDE